MIYLFNIYQVEDKEFGLEEYNERVCVIFESDDHCGESKEFESFFSKSLSDWLGFDPEITAQQVETIIGFDPSKQMKYNFEVSHPGEPGAGIIGFTDTVTIILESGIPGGDPGDFAGHLKATLVEWYDGAKVTQTESK